MNIAIIIPALNPGRMLLPLIEELISNKMTNIIVVNDGSAPQYTPVFEKIQTIPECRLITHENNRGKGRALKTSFQYVLDNIPDITGVITADADGQHCTEDIIRVAETFTEQPEKLILGARAIKKDTPWRSKFGNNLTRFIFKHYIRLNIQDTQTGLRGISTKLLPELINLYGERYEFEAHMLIHAKKKKIPVHEIPIKTIYIENNAESHFNPVLDSFRIYSLLFFHRLYS